jgi:hypothetical protein
MPLTEIEEYLDWLDVARGQDRHPRTSKKPPGSTPSRG